MGQIGDFDLDGGLERGVEGFFSDRREVGHVQGLSVDDGALDSATHVVVALVATYFLQFARG